MKFTEIMEQMPQPLETYDQMTAATDFIVTAEDLAKDERDAFMCGYFCGGSHALAANVEGKTAEFTFRLLGLAKDAGAPFTDL
jgi:hypothetical protein